ncbi:MAG: hypothetical protein KDD82_22960 [Planctomycetes bacterium]|nr:hypothetical protein [Planctomycetota bacterium]
MSRPPGWPQGEVLWEGRPFVGPSSGDYRAGGLTALAILLTYGPLLLVLEQGSPQAALRHALVVAGLWGIAHALGRSVLAGRGLTLLLGLSLHALAASLIEGGTDAAIWLPAAGVGVVGGTLLWQAQHHWGTRYVVLAGRAARGIPGRYVVNFAYDGLPRVHSDPFGSPIGNLSFEVHDVQLTTSDGQTFGLGTSTQRMERVTFPERIVSKLQSRTPRPADEAPDTPA